MKHLSDTECDVLIKQSGFNYQHGITGEKLVSATQMLSLAELHRIVRHTFAVCEEHCHHKHDKKSRR